MSQAHKDRNLARKLTPAEKREKKHVKLVGAAAEGEAPTVAVYSVDKLNKPAHRFKVRVNAEVRSYSVDTCPERYLLSSMPAICAY